MDDSPEQKPNHTSEIKSDLTIPEQIIESYYNLLKVPFFLGRRGLFGDRWRLGDSEGHFGRALIAPFCGSIILTIHSWTTQ